MKQIKLIPGKMNVPYIKCKSGYADGAVKLSGNQLKPKRVKKVTTPTIFNGVRVILKRGAV